jgi:hypothetical protein
VTEIALARSALDWMLTVVRPIPEVMSEQRQGVAAASAEWLLRAFPLPADAFGAASARWQAREATALATRLRYPTDADDLLLELRGPGGSDRLDDTLGAAPRPGEEDPEPWRTWVDEVVVSWAAALLADPALAEDAAVAAGAPLDGPLLRPSPRDVAAAALLRHPDLLAPLADLHRAELSLALLALPAA